jgi:hypothetical protein
MMSKSPVVLTHFAGLAASLFSPGTAFAQVCAPTLADGSLNRCCPINDGGGTLATDPIGCLTETMISAGTTAFAAPPASMAPVAPPLSTTARPAAEAWGTAAPPQVERVADMENRDRRSHLRPAFLMQCLGKTGCRLVAKEHIANAVASSIRIFLGVWRKLPLLRRPRFSTLCWIL